MLGDAADETRGNHQGNCCHIFANAGKAPGFGNRPALTRTPSSYLNLSDFSEIIGHVNPHSTCSRYLVSVVTGGNPGHDDR